jgi:hypothetical protein
MSTKRFALAIVGVLALATALFYGQSLAGYASLTTYDETGAILKRNAYWKELRGDISVNDILKAEQQARSLPQAAQPPAAAPGLGGTQAQSFGPNPPSGTWQLLGPAPITPLYQPALKNAGRISALVVDTTTTGANSVMYAGPANGGIWKTTNNGTTWIPLTDTATSLAIGSLAIDPTNTQVVYAGLGEHRYAGNTFNGSGILKTTNGGTTWTSLGTAFFGNRNSRIGRLFINPNNTQQIYAASTIGFAYSNDGATTWQRFTNLPDMGQIDVLDIHINFATNVMIALVSNNGLYRSTDGGANWTNITAALPAANLWDSRARIISAPSNPAVMYLAIASSVQGGSTVFTGTYNGMFYSTNGGTTWTQMTSITESFTGTQGFYNLDMIVDPFDDNKVIFGGVDLWAATDARGPAAETNYRKISSWSASASYGVHADQQALTWASGCTASPCRLLTGNDGGVYYSDNYYSLPIENISYTTMNSNGFAISQFMGGDISPNFATTKLAIGGMQDNGTARYNNNTIWAEKRGGDGGYAVIDYTNTNVMYSMYTYASLQKSTDQGENWVDAISGITPTNASNFYTHYVLDRANSNHLILGTNRVWETIDGTNNWVASSPVFDSNVSRVAIAPSNSAVMYAGLNNGKVYRTANGNTGAAATWTEITGTLPGLYITGFWISPTNPDEVYVTMGAFSYGQTHYIYKTSNAGAAWASIQGNLPTLPVWAINSYPSDSGRVLVVGTDAGMFFSTNDGTAWTALNSGFPLTTIYHVSIDPQATSIVAWTHGRSVWWLAIPQAPVARPDTIGVYNGGNWFLRNTNSAGAADITVSFGGDPSDFPVVGDWNGDGVDSIGIYRSSTGIFFLSNSNTTPNVDYSFVLGNPNDTPFAGRWTADMTISGAGVYRNSNGILYQRKTLTTGFSDFFAVFGNPGDTGFAGDWNGDGLDSIGIYRPSVTKWFMTNNGGPNGITFSDIDFVWDIGANTLPVVGDWNAVGSHRVGHFNSTSGVFTLHSALATAGTDNSFAFGPNTAKPVAGKWTAAAVPATSKFNPALNSVIVNGSTGGTFTGDTSGNAD